MNGQMEFLDKLRVKAEREESGDVYDKIARRLEFHNHSDAARIVLRMRFADKFVPRYRVNMFGPVQPPPLSMTTKFKLPRFFGKP